jgi:hypothetical protein
MIDSLQCKLKCFSKNGKNEEAGELVISQELFLFMQHALGSYLLYPLLEKIWKEEMIPKEWEEGLIIKIPKKGDLSNCNNCRGITLLSTPSKILIRVILNRIQNTVEQHLRKNKLDFANTEAALT